MKMNSQIPTIPRLIRRGITVQVMSLEDMLRTHDSVPNMLLGKNIDHKQVADSLEPFMKVYPVPYHELPKARTCRRSYAILLSVLGVCSADKIQHVHGTGDQFCRGGGRLCPGRLGR